MFFVSFFFCMDVFLCRFAGSNWNSVCQVIFKHFLLFYSKIKKIQCPLSCLIHVYHKSFWAGLKKYGSDAEELVLNLYYFITKSPARRADLFWNWGNSRYEWVGATTSCPELLAFPCAIYTVCHVYENCIAEMIHW